MIDRIRVWIREETERAAERKAALKPDPPHVTVAAWQVGAAKFAANVAMCALVYMLWIYTLQIAGDRAGEMHLTHAGTWTGDLRFWFPLLVGFALISFGVPYVAKISIPVFMALTWREAAWPKAWALGIACAVSLVIMAGTFTIQGDTILERDRDSAVAVQQVEQGRAALEAQIASAERRLSEMRNNPNAYMAQAASVGAAEWERSYIAQARASGDARLPMIERALGAARAADAEQARLDGLRVQLAQSAGTASVVRHATTTTATSWMAGVLDWVEGVRAILLSLVMDIVCLMMPWIARHLELTRNRQLGMGAGEPQIMGVLEDKSGEMPATERAARGVAEAMVDAGADPRFAANMAASAVGQSTKKGRRAFNPETGKWEVYVEPKGHWRPLATKKNPDGSVEQTLARDVMAMADETGVPDGGDRTGRSVGEQVNDEFNPAHDDSDAAHNHEEGDDRAGMAVGDSQGAQNDERGEERDDAKQLPNSQIDLPDLPITADAIDALAGLLAQQEPDADSDASEQQQSDDPGDDTHTKLPANEGVMVRELAAAK